MDSFTFKSLGIKNICNFISRSAKGIINLWNLKTKRTELILDGHSGNGILAADFLPGGKVIRLVGGIKKVRKLVVLHFLVLQIWSLFIAAHCWDVYEQDICTLAQTIAYWFCKLPRI